MSGEFQYGGVPGVVLNNSPAGAASEALAIGSRFGRVFLAPLGGGLDDMPRICSVLMACASKYPVELIPMVDYACKTTWSANGYVAGMPSWTRLKGNGARIVQSLAWGGGHTNAFLYCNPILTATTTTVHTTVKSGEKTVVVDALIAVGAWIKINRVAPYNLRAAYYQVIDRSGAGPTYTLTVDRPILEPFPANSVVTIVTSVPQDIIVDDIRITGTGERWIEMIAARGCHVNDVMCDVSGGAIGNSALLCSLDVGSYKSGFHRCSVVDNGTAGYCLTFETCEDCVFDHCIGIGAGISVSAFFDSHVCKIEGGEYSQGVSSGIVFDCDVAPGNVTYGNINCTIDGAVVAGNAGTGVQVGKGAQRTEIKNVKAIGNGISFSVVADGNTIQSQDTQIIDCLVDRPTVTGVINYAGTSGTVIRNLVSQECITDIDVRADILIEGWVSRNNVGLAFGNNALVINAANLNVRVVNATIFVTAGRIGFDLLNQPVTWLTNCKFITGDGSTAVMVRAAGMTYVAGCCGSGGAGSVGINIDATGTTYLDSLSSFTEPTPTTGAGTLKTETYT